MRLEARLMKIVSCRVYNILLHITKMKWFTGNRQKEGEQSLIQEQSKKWHQIFKNRLFLTSLLNATIFFVFVFAMGYYDWGQVSIPTLSDSAGAIDISRRSAITMYFNLLYVKMADSASYSSLSSLTDLCVQNDLVCLSAVGQLQFLGYLCFGVLSLGGVLQVYDICRMVHYLCGLGKGQGEGQFVEWKEDNLPHVLSIAGFVVGLTLNVFGMLEMDVTFSYGVSFWVFVTGLVCFIGVLAYEQVALHKLQQQKMILELIQGEKILSKKMEVNVQMSSEGQVYM